MSFFQGIADLDLTCDLNITIRKREDGKLFVAVLPVNKKVGDAATTNIIPLSFTATAADLDEQFLTAISEPMKSTDALMSNMVQYQKGIDTANKEAAMNKKKEDGAKKTEATSTPTPAAKKPEPPKKTPFEIAMDKVADLEKDKKFYEALQALPKDSAFPEKVAEIKARRRKLLELHSESQSIFNQPA